MRTVLIIQLLIFTACRGKGEDTGPYDYDGDGHVTGVDCDDDNATVHPNATEVCNNIDDDCDGLIDDSDPSIADAGTFYGDSDLDGYGGNILVVETCEQPDGYTDNQQDCNDLDALSYPGAEELCDGADNDCDDVIDEPDATDAPTWYADADGDGYGTEEDSTVSCNNPHGYAAISGDCNDEDPAFHPGAAEVNCTDSTDYNCDGSVGFADADADGHPACEDCDDNNASVYEGAAESCNGIDDDCDGLTDSDDPDVTGTSTYYGDADGDGYGGTQFQSTSCEPAAGFVANSDDCNDLDASAYPGATESCDSIDNNCDGSIDEGLATTWYADSDSDGFGNANTALSDCEAPPGYVSDANDCNDLDASAYPGGTEVCDTSDNDCDGSIDEGVQSTWYADSDGDGYGDDSVTQETCTAPAGFVSNNLDCDDTTASTNPTSWEVCDAVDNDCDGATDEPDAIDTLTFYEDIDGDGYGTTSSTTSSCTQPLGYVDNADDCNDADSAISPSATEVCDGVDNDCNGTADDEVNDGSVYYSDIDGDGFGNPNNSTSACSQPNGYTTDSSDCDDVNANSFPGATELCDGSDNDCDGLLDEDDAANTTTWYADSDGDGFGDATITTQACDLPSGFVGNNNDCNDLSAADYPSATETCDGLDNDCDGNTDEGLLGTGLACPASGCTAIQTQNAASISGVYYVDPELTGAYGVYCDFDSTDGPWAFIEADGLQAYWPFDGQFPQDAVVGQYPGTLFGNAGRSNEVPNIGFVESMSFSNDGGSYLELTSSYPGTSPTTIMFWARNTSCDSEYALHFDDNISWLGDIRENASLRLGNTNVFFSPGGCANVNTWHHHAYVDDGSQWTVYVDGVEIQPDGGYNYMPLLGYGIKRFGASPGMNTSSLDGQLDDVAFFSRALTATELQNIVSQGLVGYPLRWR